MKNLKVKHDALSQKDFDEKMKLLENKFSEIEKDINGKSLQSFEIQEALGFKKIDKRKVMNLAEFTAQIKTKEELIKEQQEATDFIKKL